MHKLESIDHHNRSMRKALGANRVAASRAAAPCLIESLENRVFLSVNPFTTTSAGSQSVTAADATPTGNQPMVTSASPAPGATNVPLDTFVSCEVFVPNGGIDPA